MDPLRILRKFEKKDFVVFGLTIACIVISFWLYHVSQEYTFVTNGEKTLNVRTIYDMSLALTENAIAVSLIIIYRRLVRHG